MWTRLSIRLIKSLTLLFLYFLLQKKKSKQKNFFKERTQTLTSPLVLKQFFNTIFKYMMLYNPLLFSAHTMEDMSGLQDEFLFYSKYFTDSSTDSFIMWTEPFTVNLFKSTFRIFGGKKITE